MVLKIVIRHMEEVKADSVLALQYWSKEEKKKN